VNAFRFFALKYPRGLIVKQGMRPYYEANFVLHFFYHLKPL